MACDSGDKKVSKSNTAEIVAENKDFATNTESNTQKVVADFSKLKEFTNNLGDVCKSQRDIVLGKNADFTELDRSLLLDLGMKWESLYIQQTQNGLYYANMCEDPESTATQQR